MFTLPYQLPSSFEGIHGSLRYYVRASLNRRYMLDAVFKKGFTVNNVVDLNLIYQAPVSHYSVCQKKLLPQSFRFLIKKPFSVFFKSRNGAPHSDSKHLPAYKLTNFRNSPLGTQLSLSISEYSDLQHVLRTQISSNFVRSF